MNFIAIGVFLLGVVLLIFWARRSGFLREGFESSPAYKMVMYGVDWCPHCVSAKPEFQQLGTTKTIGGKVVELQVVNPETEEGKVAAAGKNVSGYPTFHLYDSSGKLVKEYEGERSKAGFEAFLNQMLGA